MEAMGKPWPLSHVSPNSAQVLVSTHCRQTLWSGKMKDCKKQDFEKGLNVSFIYFYLVKWMKTSWVVSFSRNTYKMRINSKILKGTQVKLSEKIRDEDNLETPSYV